MPEIENAPEEFNRQLLFQAGNAPAQFILDARPRPARPRGPVPADFEIITSGTDNRTIAEIFKIRGTDRLLLGDIEKFIESQQMKIPYPYKFTQDTKSLIGIEVEVENILRIDPNISLCFWGIKEDGSLRNNGREFVSYPIPIRYAEYALTQLDRGLNPDRDFSVRTSIHIHQDVRGFSLNNFVSLMFLYLASENLLFKFAGNNRRNSIYCVPISETQFLATISDLNELKSSILNGRHWWHKYSAFNILPSSSLGTIEYRHMPGTLDVRRLLIWIDLLSRLRIAAYRTDYMQIVDTISRLNTNSEYRIFLESVFGDLIHYLDLSTLQADMEKNVYMLKNCAISNSFHQRVKTTKLSSSMVHTYLGIVPLEKHMTGADVLLLRQLCAEYWKEYSAEDIYQNMTQDPKGYAAVVIKRPEYYNLMARLFPTKIKPLKAQEIANRVGAVLYEEEERHR